ncbi:MAG TPA: ABC transporter substrate-binding protein [Thermoanaerobaculia bacterium]|jgi:polar amino acid transport system substrate-binding protein|nr:ABC transporter substrate-binding protein [Thermoanaerobaculia bacterium]
MTRSEGFPHQPAGGKRGAGWLPALAGAFLILARAAGAGDLSDVKARGKLVMLCYPSQNSTFVSADLETMREKDLKLSDLRSPEHFSGLDVELIKGFAKSLGVDLEIHPITTGYDALFPALFKGEGDVVASSLSITPKRLESVDFSDPYLTSWVAVAVPMGSKVASVDDLAGKKVALMHGSSQLEFLQSQVPDVKILLTDFSLENYVAVKDGEADFTLMDSRAPVGGSVSGAYPDLKVAFRLREFGYGVAVRKGSDLREPLNAYLAHLKESGELARLVDRFDTTSGAQSAPPR